MVRACLARTRGQFRSPMKAPCGARAASLLKAILGCLRTQIKRREGLKMSARARGLDFHFLHSSHFSWSVLTPRPLMPMFFKGLGQSQDIYGQAHMCIILPHGAAGGPLCRLLIYTITRESPRRLAQTKALRLCDQQKARAAEIAGHLSSGRSGSGDYQRAWRDDRRWRL